MSLAPNEPVDEPTLRDFLGRVLGWGKHRAVDRAVRSIHLSLARDAVLVLLGEDDLVPLALALHRRTLGAARPFVVCDPRRGNWKPTVRSPGNRVSGAEALAAAAGGTLCLRHSRLPDDYAKMTEMAREPDAAVRVVVCAAPSADPFLILPGPLTIPPLASRAEDLPRIIEEYGQDAVATLGARPDAFTAEDRAWIARSCATTLHEVEKAALRLVALRMAGSISGAAGRLGMAPVSLRRWIARKAE
ncbi:MAG: hypothetical protein IPI49_17550 [Myxococcales bacterium]|nr:hypothetical protein [Myxococcales bacterium]